MKQKDLLHDIEVRFLSSLKDEHLATADRLLFQIELAHWYYEDFVKTFSSPEFTFHPESMEAVKTEKTLIKSKIDKKRYLDYDHLTDIVLQYNNGSIYFNPSTEFPMGSI